jgi:hypothetical protein
MIYFQMLLGHLVGDYLLQNEWMAMNKSKNTWIGWISAFVHCVLYTLAVCTVMWNFTPIWILIVFLSHFPIDKFAFANIYMHYVKGKSMKDYVKKDNVDYVDKEPLNRYDILEGSFTAIVYTVTDNTLHLLIMYIAYILIN